jgi:hypothetical protein
MKAPKFAKPHERTFLALFDDISEEFGQSEADRKGSKKSNNTSDETPASPLKKIFGTHMSFSNRNQARKTFDGSMNDLSRPSIVAGDNQSPRFLKDAAPKGSPKSDSSEKINSGQMVTQNSVPNIGTPKSAATPPTSPSPAAASKNAFRPSLAPIPLNSDQAPVDSIIPIAIHH